MSTRLSFFNVSRLAKIGLDTFAGSMQGERFTAKSASGFLVDSSSKRRLEARYVERISTVEMLTDPFGKPYRVESTYFSEQKFLLAADSPELVIIDSNSSSRALTGRLCEFSDFSIAIEPLDWSPESILACLAKRVPTARVYAAKVDDQMLSSAIQVRMTFEGADTDVRPYIRKFLRKEKVVFASVKIDFEHAGALRRCEIKSNGTIQTFGAYDPVMTDLWIAIVRSFRASTPTL